MRTLATLAKTDENGDLYPTESIGYISDPYIAIPVGARIKLVTGDPPDEINYFLVKEEWQMMKAGGNIDAVRVIYLLQEEEYESTDPR